MLFSNESVTVEVVLVLSIKGKVFCGVLSGLSGREVSNISGYMS